MSIRRKLNKIILAGSLAVMTLGTAAPVIAETISSEDWWYSSFMNFADTQEFGTVGFGPVKQKVKFITHTFTQADCPAGFTLVGAPNNFYVYEIKRDGAPVFDVQSTANGYLNNFRNTDPVNLEYAFTAQDIMGYSTLIGATRDEYRVDMRYLAWYFRGAEAADFNAAAGGEDIEWLFHVPDNIYTTLGNVINEPETSSTGYFNQYITICVRDHAAVSSSSESSSSESSSSYASSVSSSSSSEVSSSSTSSSEVSSSSTSSESSSSESSYSS